MLDTEEMLGRQIRTLLVALVTIAGSFMIWSLFVPLDGAVSSTGTVVVDGNIKKVQHQQGGIVGSLLVKEGAHVKEGDVIARLDDTQTRANLGVIANEMIAVRARIARLVAERDGTDDILFPPQLLSPGSTDPVVRNAIDSERSFFRARRTALLGTQAQLRERIGQLEKEVEGTDQQLRSSRDQIAIARSEHEALLPLREKGLVQKPRITSLEREISRFDGAIGDAIARIAQSRGKITETEVQIGQVLRDRLADVSKDLREAEAKLNELTERRMGAEDQLKRVEIRSPATGIVHELAVHTVGGVVQPGELLMTIVPDPDDLVVEARIQPKDIDQVHENQPSRLRFTSFNQRTTPELHGKVVRRSANTTLDKINGQPFYTVAVKPDPGQLERLNGAHLLPGMMAEAFITTESRTAMSFLMKPLVDNWQRVFSTR